jgi:ABC-type nitrate/sulfonate/bicarbonate transport system substrate-binding protein
LPAIQVGEYFVYYALSIAQLSPRSQVTLVPQDSVEDAIDVFNNGQADVVSAWEPNIYDAEAERRRRAAQLRAAAYRH